MHAHVSTHLASPSLKRLAQRSPRPRSTPRLYPRAGTIVGLGGELPSGKAADFGSAIRRFESFLPSQIL